MTRSFVSRMRVNLGDKKFREFEQVGILLSLSKITRAHFLNLVFFLRIMKTRILSGFF